MLRTQTYHTKRLNALLSTVLLASIRPVCTFGSVWLFERTDCGVLAVAQLSSTVGGNWSVGQTPPTRFHTDLCQMFKGVTGRLWGGIMWFHLPRSSPGRIKIKDLLKPNKKRQTLNSRGTRTDSKAKKNYTHNPKVSSRGGLAGSILLPGEPIPYLHKNQVIQSGNPILL